MAIGLLFKDGDTLVLHVGSSPQRRESSQRDEGRPGSRSTSQVKEEVACAAPSDADAPAGGSQASMPTTCRLPISRSSGRSGPPIVPRPGLITSRDQPYTGPSDAEAGPHATPPPPAAHPRAGMQGEGRQGPHDTGAACLHLMGEEQKARDALTGHVCGYVPFTFALADTETSLFPAATPCAQRRSARARTANASSCTASAGPQVRCEHGMKTALTQHDTTQRPRITTPCSLTAGRSISVCLPAPIGAFCSGCLCQDCFNKPENEQFIRAEQLRIRSRNPLAFSGKVSIQS